jgi:hypothetical protein
MRDVTFYASMVIVDVNPKPRRNRDGATVQTVAVICDPEAAPAEIADHLHRVLPGLLAQSSDATAVFDVCLHRERLPIGPQAQHQPLLEHAGRVKRSRGWDAAVCVTDLPLCNEDDEPLVADMSIKDGVAVVSLPAFGAPRLRRRVTEVLVEILKELVPAAQGGTSDLSPVSSVDHHLPGPYRLVTPQDSAIDAQVVAGRGVGRQLLGMVRANRPWRLFLGLRRGVVAALAFSVLLLINPVVWQLGIGHSWRGLLLVSAGVVAAMAAWLVYYHHLWVHRVDGVPGRRKVLLYNASTVITFVLGLGVAFLGLLAVNVMAARVLLSDHVLTSQLGHTPGIVEYLKLCWMATVCASAIGALGTGFESEEDVRDAAYSEREAQRGAVRRRRSDTEASG